VNCKIEEIQMKYEQYTDEIKDGIMIRLVEQRLLELFSEGRINGTVHTCVGQELTGVFVSKYLNPEDHIVSNHRGHGHYLSRFMDIKGLISEIMGRAEGVSGGVGGSQHIVNKNYLSNGIQGGMIPIAAGIALQYKRENNKNISLAYIGDGTLGEGVIYETFNIAAIWDLPLIIVMENNSYAQSTSIIQSFSGDIRKRIEGYGLQYFRTSTWDLENLDMISKEAITYCREHSKPVFIEINTYRLNSHSKGDDNRSSDELISFNSKDVISSVMRDENPEYEAHIQKCNKMIESIIEEVEQCTDELNLNIDKKYNVLTLKRDHSRSPEVHSSRRYNELLNEALCQFMENNPESVLMGEDVEYNNKYTPGEYGGAFKVTKNMSELFPFRILNTPISEAAIVGLSTGYSIKSGRTIVEIMFGDFTTLIFDQILQNLSKFEYMYNGKVKTPVVIRTPMGGKRGYGPTHSQSIEKHFLGIPNFAVVALNHRLSPNFIYESICRVSGLPFMVIENKILYTLKTDTKRVEGYNYKFSDNLFPSITIEPIYEEPSFTIICYGEVLYELEMAVRRLFLEDELFAEIICPSLISPVDIDEIKKSVGRTQKLCIIEEGPGEASWSSEVVAQLLEQGIKIEKLVRQYNREIIPANRKREATLLTTFDTILSVLKKMKD
jgi:2-oxoisovalerate dehydrogenase E1 component